MQQLHVRILAAAAILACGSAQAATLSVGPGKTYATPCQAFAASAAGDLIEIDAAGSYSGNVCGIYTSNLTIRGVNGRPKIDAAGANSMGKGTWVVIGNNTVIENVEMTGAKVIDRNGAAIRLDGTGLTLRGSYLHDNENGILTGANANSDIVIENSEFSHNGYGDGYTHNLYIGNVKSLTFRNNYSHDANVGHNLKSRAQTNVIMYNRFSSSGLGQPSYEINMPNAGTAYVIGNVIHQPAGNQNPAMLTFGEEGASNTAQDLYVVNNTFINDDTSRGTFIMTGSGVTTPVLMQNNVFAGTGTANTQAGATDKTNLRTLTPAFVSRSTFDLHPLDATMIDAGSAVGVSRTGVSLAPVAQYKHIAGAETRTVAGAAIDIGAYEAGTATGGTTTTPTAPTTTTTPTAPTTTTPTAPTTTTTPTTPTTTTTPTITKVRGKSGK
jgi:hypothetical protein